MAFLQRVLQNGMLCILYKPNSNQKAKVIGDAIFIRSVHNL